MWKPTLPLGKLPLYERLMLALTEDIRTGRLEPGTRLPPQRDLAFQLGISVGSVTRAYAEAERQGLLIAHVGRGSFVRGPLMAPQPPATAGQNELIDLRHNVPPAMSLTPVLHNALLEALARGLLAQGLHYGPATGLPLVRAAGAQWLADAHGLKIDMQDLVQCNGGQHGIALVFAAFCRPGDVILCESSSFYGARLAADQLGLVLKGLPMDAEGLLPDALDQAAQATGSRLLFTLPTLHNPTTRTMSDRRRQEIVKIARARDLLILEDEAYYAYSERPRQIISYAPERTIYLASLSKAYCPGLRLAFLALPPALPRERLLRGIRALGYCPPAWGGLIFSQWVETRQLETIGQSIQAEAATRWALARSILGPLLAPAGAAYSPHGWVPMPALEAERMTARLLRAGVDVTPPDISIISKGAETGLRLCLGAPQTSADLKRALMVFKEIVSATENTDHDGIL